MAPGPVSLPNCECRELPRAPWARTVGPVGLWGALGNSVEDPGEDPGEELGEDSTRTSIYITPDPPPLAAVMLFLVES